jgi:hypothetical protein
MSEIELVPFGHKMKSKGVYNMEELYVEMQLWFVHMGYTWREVEYKKIGFPGGGYRMEIIWIGDKAVDDYTSFQIKLVLAADISDVEVVLDGGKKVKRQKAGIEIRSGASLFRNDGYFKDSIFNTGTLQKNVYEYLIRGRLRQQETDLWVEAHKLYDELKAFMLIYPH